MSRPRPPYSSAMVEPKRPNSHIWSNMACGKVSDSSNSEAVGMTSRSTHCLMVPTISSASA